MVNGFVATSLTEALTAMATGSYTPYIGGTDLMVGQKQGANYLFLHRVPQMKEIVEDEHYLRLGASCTFTEVLQHKKSHPLLKQ